MPYKILIVDDHALVREGLALLVSRLSGGVTVYMAATAAEALAQAEYHTPLDAILLDCGLPDADGGNLISALSARGGGAPVVVVSANETAATINRVMQAGAVEFVPKSEASDKVVNALKRALLSGGGSKQPPSALGGLNVSMNVNAGSLSSDLPPNAPSLTARQLDVLLMLDQGQTNRDIALQLGLSEKTVKNHVTALFNALGAVNRLQAIRKARDACLIG